MKSTCMAIACLALAAGGCYRAPARLGFVLDTPEARYRAGSIGPVVPVRTADGTLTTLQGLARPPYVVAFVEPPMADRGGIDPRVRELARRLAGESIQVVQVTEPTEDEPLAGIELAGRAEPDGGLVLLLDPHRVAWKAFGPRRSGKLYLLDRDRTIRGEGTLGDPKELLWHARRVATEVEAEEWQQWLEMLSSD